MNRPEKWQPVTAASKVRAVARSALAARLERAAKNLNRAAKKSEDQADNVHKLRTWCRRSAAAVELFRPLLPKKERKWFARQLKNVRQSAGEVRDLDVMLEQAADHVPLAKELMQQRDRAVKPLLKMHKRLVKSEQFDKRQRLLLGDIDQPKKRLGEWGKDRAGKQASALAALGERSLKPLEAAHEFRIACKELRYVLEIIGGALPVAAVKLYALLGDLQQRIGVVCDHAAAVTMYQALLTKVDRSQRRPLREAIAKAKQDRARTHQAFLRWWTPRRRTGFRGALAKAGLL